MPQAKNGVPAEFQNLVYAGRQLGDEATLAASGVEKGSTLHLVFALYGGKGGFGALLRGAGVERFFLTPPSQQFLVTKAHRSLR